MHKHLNVFLPAIILVSMLAVPALADWKETGFAPRREES